MLQTIAAYGLKPTVKAGDARRRCECGSGLASERCCELDVAAARPEGLAVPAMVQLALESRREGDVAATERACLAVLDTCPVQRDAIRMLLQLRRAGNRPRAAEALLRRLAQLDPNDVAVAIDLGLLLMGKGDFAGAEIPARNAVRIAPTNPQSHNLLAMVLTEAHRPHAGEFHYRRALQLSGARDPILIANLAWNLRNQGRIAEARELYFECTRAGPPVQQTLLGWARLEEADRQFDRAHEILDQAEAHFPSDPQFLLARAIVIGRTGQHDAALTILERLTALSPDGLGPEALMEQGALLDRLGQYDRAFAAFAEGKRKVRHISGESYQAERALDLTRRLKQFFTAQRRNILPQAAVREDTAQPIFIVGFPRSGTTMVEQILSSHPQITAGDELPIVDELSGAVPRLFASPLTYPEALAELWMSENRDGLDVLRDYYLRRARQMGAVQPGAEWFTDKMPLNETHLGLISLMFPRSPVIHVIRHPADVVLSAFSNHMTHGFFCSYELETAARHYVLTMDLVEHYRRELDLHYTRVRYEDLVQDLESGTRRMLDFVPLPFNERCLRFHENPRFARTASYAQVTQKLYARSRFRYRNYHDWLDPVMHILQPAIERLGYTSE